MSLFRTIYMVVYPSFVRTLKIYGLPRKLSEIGVSYSSSSYPFRINQPAVAKQPKERTNLNEQETLIKDCVLEGKPIDHIEWDKIRNDILRMGKIITSLNVDATVIGHCLTHDKLEVAKSYIEYLKSRNLEPNIATAARLLRLYYRHYNNKEMTSTDEDHIIKIHNKLLQRGTLDACTCENIIHALALTRDWEKCTTLLNMIDVTCSPSASTYSVVIEAAFKNNKPQLGWKLLHEMVLKERPPMCIVFTAWFNYCTSQCTSDAELLANLEKMLHFITDNDVRISKDVTQKLVNAFEAMQWTGSYTSIMNGTCNSCQKKLSPAVLSTSEFEALRSEFLERVLVRGNVFVRSSPAELETFMNFVDKTAPYDVVVDGLNVAYSGGKKSHAVLAHMVTSVVRHFVDKRKKVLVIGRRHMMKWPVKYVQYLVGFSQMFLAEDLSHDDPFLLYAALRSGPQTDFVSRDLMRGHAYLLEDRQLKNTFKRWQQQHQYQVIYITDNGKVTFKPPMEYMPTPQKSSAGWHLPYISTYQQNQDTLDAPIHWLCLHDTTADRAEQERLDKINL